MTYDDGNYFVNFALNAVLGKMAEADELMRRAAGGIYRASAAFASRWPTPCAPLYRGVLVDLSVPIEVDARYTFVSWSEDIDVACWFASTNSTISQPLAESNPRLRGFIFELPVAERVLFHYSWARGWGRLALLHPHMGVDGARQITWSLHTQREVITAPLDRFPRPVPVEDLRRRSVSELDRKFSPPWLDSVNSERTTP